MEKWQATELVTRLYEKTKRDEISWETTEEETEFQSVFAGYSVRIALVESSDDRGEWHTTYVLRLYNSVGRLMDTFWADPTVLDGLQPDDPGKSKNIAKLMEFIYEQARNRALGVDVAIDEILKALA
jgi:hypothetical protein